MAECTSLGCPDPGTVTGVYDDGDERQRVVYCRECAAALEDDGAFTPDALANHYGAPMHMPMGTTCAVHVHREWVPIEAHHIWPKGMGGPDVKANKVSVCANGHYSIHEVIRRLIANNGALPDARHFSAKVKALAMRGWVEAGKPTHGGGGE